MFTAELKRNSHVTCPGRITGRYVSLQKTVDDRWHIVEILVQDDPKVATDSLIERKQ